MENVTTTPSNRDFDRVVSAFDGGQDAGTTSLWGFLGPAGDDMYRLYTDVSFTRFYEIPKARIVWTEAGEDDGDVASTRVVVAGGSELELTESAAAGASYLDGAIAAGYLPNLAEQQAQYACGNVLTTLVCTVTGAPGGAAGADPTLCLTLVTVVPTWCIPTQDCPAADAARGGDDPGCGQVLATLVCTLGLQAEVHNDGCIILLGTTACTIDGNQIAKGDAGCGELLATTICTVAAPGANAVAAGCGQVLTTAVCTLAASPNAKAGCVVVFTSIACTIGQEQLVACTTYVTANPSGCAANVTTCGQVLTTIVCTLAGQAAAQGGDGCINIGTLVCTVNAGELQDAGQVAGGCGGHFNTALCTIAGGNAGAARTCIGVATLACTFAQNAAAVAPTICIQVLATTVCTITAAPNAAVAPTICIQVLATTVCTITAGANAAVTTCGQVLTTLVCTIGEDGGRVCATYVTARPTICAAQAANVACGNVLTTAVCTLPAPKGAAANAVCQERVFTVGCTYARAENDCKQILFTAGCTFVAAKADGCKQVLFTAGCTFAGRNEAGCKQVLWTAGCTVGAAAQRVQQTCVVVTTTLIGCTFAGAQNAQAAGGCVVNLTIGCTTFQTIVCTTTGGATCAGDLQARWRLGTCGPTRVFCTNRNAERAAAPGGLEAGPVCITVHTRIPTPCEQQVCGIVPTVPPTHCPGTGPCGFVPTIPPTFCTGPCGIVPTIPPTFCPPQNCGIVPTIPPTFCTGPCGIVPTIPPTFCPQPCLTYFTAVPTHCGPQAAVAGGGSGKICLDFITAVPSICEGPGPVMTFAPFC